MNCTLQQYDDVRRRAGWTVATWTAGVAAAFVATIVIVMVHRFTQQANVDPLAMEILGPLKEQLAQRPEDEAIKGRIREVDLAVRRGHFVRRQFLLDGTWLLLGGMIAFVVAAKTAAKLAARPYLPEEPPVHSSRTTARGAVLAGAAAVAGVMTALAVAPRYRVADFATVSQDAAKGAPSEGEVPPPEPTPGMFARNWPVFRGPSGVGVAVGEYPTEWDGASGKNILWKAEIPLPGHNSPVVWEDRVFISGATQERREVYCFDARTGAMKWRRPVGAAGGEAPKIMEDTGYAANTLACDGRRVYAIFPTGDLAAFELTGKPAWSKNLGLPDSPYGYASSLTVFGNSVIVQYDQGTSEEDGKSAIMAFDGASGRELWNTPRPAPGSWSSPVVVQTTKGPQLIACANPWVIAYKPDTGEEIWRANGLSGDVAPSPAFAKDVVYATQEGADMLAIRCDGGGDVTESHISWKASDGLPDIVSPLATGDFVFWLTTAGSVTCADAGTGETMWQQDLEGPFHASPILVGDKVYLLSAHGVMHIFEAGKEYKEVAAPKIGDDTNATPAFVGGKIYVRGRSTLYCIGGKP